MRSRPRISIHTIWKRVRQGKVDYITFTSSSTVTNFVQIMAAENVQAFDQQVRVACIGPITAATARANGFRVDLMPEKYTIAALLEAIIQDYSSRVIEPRLVQ